MVAATATACTVTPSARGDLAENRQILDACDASAPPAADVQLDGSGSSDSAAIVAERMAAVEEIVRQTAICSGRLRVSVFSASSAANTVLFDEPLHLDGATENARLKRVPHVVEETMSEIEEAYEPAVAELPGGGSDIRGQYRMASEWSAQVGDDFRLHLYVLTDGFQNVGVDVGGQAMTPQEAAALADETAVPTLPGAFVTVAGIGRVAGSPPSSTVTERLVAYYDAVCAQAEADVCTSVTDYTSGSW
ncbi:hypothetical protein RM780_22310 [Streptomyces sp. DSM 44917]|uniref:VWFA domain-containing protein n=1 Tax=Streptomyces boetiae TaxID=3075541 RepID=A0ABU2LDK9_9ACTN|nr:hypothetical protein [Streptomyces sp. DSM 44917]MDT0309669.1 hypothetical protein [Streptomyces sp. DSM 44917]